MFCFLITWFKIFFLNLQAHLLFFGLKYFLMSLWSLITEPLVGVLPDFQGFEPSLHARCLLVTVSSQVLWHLESPLCSCGCVGLVLGPSASPALGKAPCALGKSACPARVPWTDGCHSHPTRVPRHRERRDHGALTYLGIVLPSSLSSLHLNNL